MAETKVVESKQDSFTQEHPSTDAKAWIQIVVAILLTIVSDGGLYYGNKALNPWEWVTNEQKGIQEKKYVRYEVDETGAFIRDESGAKVQTESTERSSVPHPFFKYISDLVNER